VQDRYQVSCRRACALARICPNTWYYKSQARDAAALRMRIREIAQARPRFGYVRIWIMLRREGWPANKKRIHRLYRLEGLQVRMRARRKKRLSLQRGISPPASGRDQAWSMDFVHDQLVTGRAFRVLTVIDQWSRESVLMEANVALTGQSVVDAKPCPRVVRCRRPSRSIMAPSSRPTRSMSGPIVAASGWTSSDPVSPSRTPLSRVSMAACAMSA
jgi:putative transposase